MKKYVKILSDIRFWIVLFFIVRLYGITDPPLESAHSWRQSMVTMVARNFYETDSNILHPRIDFAGEKSGITGMEFPALNYLIYLVSLIFGYTHWYGRLINLVVSSIGIYYFYLLAKKYFEEKTAFNATIVLLSSIWFMYSRKIMPDTFAMALLLTGTYYGTSYLDRCHSMKNIALYFIFTLAGVISKLPVGYFLILYLPFFVNKEIKWLYKILFFIVTIIILVPVYLWYFCWVPHLVDQYGFFAFFMGRDFSTGVSEIFSNLGGTAHRFYDTALKYIGFFVFVFGVFIGIKRKNYRLITILLLCFFSFSLVILKAGYVFPQHSYYIIPFVPVMALACGYGLSAIRNKKIMLVFLLAIVVEGVLNQQDDFRIKKATWAVYRLDEELNKFSDKKDRIVINSEPCPTPIYFTHRKGWIATNKQIQDADFVSDLIARGCKYIIILKQSFGTNSNLKYNEVLNNEYYTIYKLP